MTRYEDVQRQTTEEYFNGNSFSVDAFNKKYAAFAGETYVQALKRVCDYVASVEETEGLREHWSRRWFDEIYNDWWHPAGSIMQGAGSGKAVSLANCTTVSLGTRRDGEEWDSLEAIIRGSAYTVAKCAAYRQGLGVDFSRVRPAGMGVLNSANESTGAVHWMKLVDSLGYFVGQKGRIPAMLFSLSCRHPDVFAFCGVKASRTDVQNANISVQVTDDFYEAVSRDGEWELAFDVPAVRKGERVWVDGAWAADGAERCPETGRWFYVSRRDRPAESLRRTVRARELLEVIARNMCEHAEPGIQNIDLARQWSNSDYLYDENSPYDCRIISSNACSEQYLSRESLCVLASQNAGKFSPDLEQFEIEQSRVAPSVNHFLDNVNECELRYGTYATEQQRLAIEMLRRTGAGFTNLGAWLFKRGEPYGSPEAVESTRLYATTMNHYLYKHSIENGRVKGSFGMFDREKLERSPFVRSMMARGLEFDALRNVTNSSVAPTGTLSLMFREEVMSYGGEPPFGAYYWKRTRISGRYEYYFCVPSVVREELRRHGVELPISSDTVRDSWDGRVGLPVARAIDAAMESRGLSFRRATEVTPRDKLDMMSAMMCGVDSSISITYMLPAGTDWRGVADFILEARRRGVKSIAAFPDRQMYGIVSYEPFKSLAERLTREGVSIHEQNFTPDELSQLSDARPAGRPESPVRTHAPKRPKTVPCDVHVVRSGGSKFTVAVGLLGGAPYEVIARDGDVAPPGPAQLRKVRRGVYALLSPSGEELCDNMALCPADEESLTRMVSTSLRHGADVRFVAGQLDKTRGDLQSFGKALARALKKYIKDGEAVSGASCPDCSQSLIYAEGCSLCPSCGWSRC